MCSLSECVQRAWLPPGPGASVATAAPVPGSAGHCRWQYRVARDELGHPDLGSFAAECLQAASPVPTASPELQGSQENPMASTPPGTRFAQVDSRMPSEKPPPSSFPRHN